MVSAGMENKSPALSHYGAHGAPTHVRLGAGHGGDPHLPGQHRGDVEVCDVHVPWQERRTTGNVSAFNSGAQHASN